MATSREQIMTALLAKLTGALQASFTANTDGATGILTNVSSTANLYIGLPVFGPGISAGSVINVIGSNTITLSLNTTASATGVAFTSGFQTKGRRVLLWSKVSAFPAIFLRNVSDRYETRDGQPARRTLDAEIWIYSTAGQNPDLAPGVALNNILDAIEAVLAPDNIMVNRQTLGGLVYHCRIDGKVEYDPGDLDGYAKALIPVSILVP